MGEGECVGEGESVWMRDESEWCMGEWYEGDVRGG